VEKAYKLNLHYRIGPTKLNVLIKRNNWKWRRVLSSKFGGNLFGSGQLLDANKYFIILTDDIGHGDSSKPSDGLHMNFQNIRMMTWFLLIINY
jgi:homoserine O-acetyltransferase